MRAPERRFGDEAWEGANDLPYACDPIAQVLVQGLEGMTLNEIGLCLGISRERVRQIELTALDQFVRGLRDEGLTLAEVEEILRWLVSRRDAREGSRGHGYEQSEG